MQMYKYKALHTTVFHAGVPHYLGPLVHVADIPGWRTLRSAVTNHLAVPLFVYLVGNSAFTVAAPQIWNSLLDDIISSVSLYLLPPTEDFLLSVSFSDLIL